MYENYGCPVKNSKP